MTAKEKLHERVETLSEREAEETLRLLQDWKPGDIRALGRATGCG